MGAECPPAMPVTGLHRTVGLAAFVGAWRALPSFTLAAPSYWGKNTWFLLAAFMFLPWINFKHLLF